VPGIVLNAADLEREKKISAFKSSQSTKDEIINVNAYIDQP
jgi:hypothetical protein